MTQFTINVQIGLTPELTAVLLPLVAKLQSEKQPAAAPAVEEPAAVAAVEAKPRRKKQEAAPAIIDFTEEAPAAEAAPVEEPAAEEAPAEQSAAEAAEEKKEYTLEDVRAAMDRTRRRIEGEDFKENITGELYKKWHRTLSGWFKNTAAIHGAEKPSALPDSDSRAAFIRECDEVIVENDQLTTKCPY